MVGGGGQQIQDIHLQFLRIHFYTPLKYVTIVFIVYRRWSKLFYCANANNPEELCGNNSSIVLYAGDSKQMLILTPLMLYVSISCQK